MVHTHTAKHTAQPPTQDIYKKKKNSDIGKLATVWIHKALRINTQTPHGTASTRCYNHVEKYERNRVRRLCRQTILSTQDTHPTHIAQSNTERLCTHPHHKSAANTLLEVADITQLWHTHTHLKTHIDKPALEE